MKIGDKVVCLDASGCWCCGLSNLKVNAVYVINGTNIQAGRLKISLVGLKDVKPGLHKDDSWLATRFRLLDELKQEARQRVAVNDAVKVREL